MSRKDGNSGAFKVFVTIVIFLLIVFLGIQIVPPILEANGIEFPIKAIPDLVGSKEPVTNESLYNKFFTELMAGEMKVDAGRINDDTIETIVTRVYDSPELFWLSNNCTITTIGSHKIVSFNSIYTDVEKRQKEIDAAADEILKGVPEGDDFDKVLYLHDALCEHITYYDDGTADSHNVYGALVNGRCVCEGYSKALAYLVNKIGLMNFILSGNASNGDYSGPHAWNAVEMDGKVYYIDVTWDDSEELGISYDYFGLTSAEIQKNHSFDDNHMVAYTTATDDNYFKRQGYLIEDYSDEAIIDVISKQDDHIYVKCSSILSYEKMVSTITNPQKFMEIVSRTGKDATYKQYSYSLNDDMYTATLWLYK